MPNAVVLKAKTEEQPAHWSPPVYLPHRCNVPRKGLKCLVASAPESSSPSKSYATHVLSTPSFVCTVLAVLLHARSTQQHLNKGQHATLLIACSHAGALAAGAQLEGLD